MELDRRKREEMELEKKRKRKEKKRVHSEEWQQCMIQLKLLQEERRK